MGSPARMFQPRRGESGHGDVLARRPPGEAEMHACGGACVYVTWDVTTKGQLAGGHCVPRSASAGWTSWSQRVRRRQEPGGDVTCGVGDVMAVNSTGVPGTKSHTGMRNVDGLHNISSQLDWGHGQQPPQYQASKERALQPRCGNPVRTGRHTVQLRYPGPIVTPMTRAGVYPTPTTSCCRKSHRQIRSAEMSATPYYTSL